MARTARILTEEQKARQKAWRKQQREAHKKYLSSLTPGQLAEYKQNKIWEAESRKRSAAEKAAKVQHNKKIKREKTLLKFMLKNDVLSYHHGQADSKLKEIKIQLDILTKRNTYREYDPYVWNRLGEGNNHLPLSHMGCLWRSNEFETIYDVPLDGSYTFYIYDSGERGLGSFSRITACKKGENPFVPKVNPGGIPQITAD